MSDRRREGFLAVILLCLALSCAELIAAGKDEVTLKNGRIVAGVTILRDGFDKVEVDRDGDGKTDESFPSEAVAVTTYEDAPAVFRQALVSFKFNRFEKAAEEFAKALEDKAARAFWLHQQAGYFLGECRRKLAEMNAELYPQARAAYEICLKAAPDGRMVPFALRGIGLCHMKEGKLHLARDEFTQLADAKFGSDWAWRAKLHLAQVASLEQKHKEALELCEEVIKAADAAKQAELLQEANLIRPELLIAAGEFAKARELLIQAAKAADERDIDAKARAYNAIGDCYLAEGSPKEALLAYLRVRILYFKSKDEYPRALFGAAMCFALLKEAEKSREILEVLQKEHPDSLWTAKARQEL